MGMKFTNTTRYKNDTFPIEGTIEINGDYLDITGYTVYYYYDEFVNNAHKLIRIEVIQLNAREGSVAVYPKINYSYDITDPDNIVPYVPFTKTGVFDYSVVRTKTIYDKYSLGEYVTLNGTSYIPYVEIDHSGLQRYTKFVEKYTHSVGKITILDRVGE